MRHTGFLISSFSQESVLQNPCDRHSRNDLSRFVLVLLDGLTDRRPNAAFICCYLAVLSHFYKQVIHAGGMNLFINQIQTVFRVVFCPSSSPSGTRA